MAYIRVKNISGYKYAYLVESITTSNGPRQKVKQYLGRVHDLNSKDSLKEVSITSKSIKNNILRLVLTELTAKGFKEKKGLYVWKNFYFSPTEFTLLKKTKTKSFKSVIISSHEGYLCTFTLQRLLNFKRSKDLKQDGYDLAKYFLEAGLKVSPETFVKFYQLLV